MFPSKDHLTFIKQSITPPTYGIQQRKHPKDEWRNELTNLAINLSIKRFELPSKRSHLHWHHWPLSSWYLRFFFEIHNFVKIWFGSNMWICLLLKLKHELG